MFFFQLKSIEFEQFMLFFNFLILTFNKALLCVQNVQNSDKTIDISGKKAFELLTKKNVYTLAEQRAGLLIAT